MDGLAENLQKNNYLLNDETFSQPSQDAATKTLILRGLTRSTIYPGRISSSLKNQQNSITAIVGTVLGSSSADNHEMTFDFVSEQSRQMVVEMVSKIMGRWTIAVNTNNRFENFASYLNDHERIIILVAEQTMELLDHDLTAFDYNNANDRKKAVDVIASRDISYIKDFFSPNYIKNWFKNNNLDETLADKYQRVFSPAVKKRILTHNINNPDKAISKIIYNLEEVLTDENIASMLGLDESEVSKIFTPSVKKHFAIININNPLKGCLKWAQGTRKMNVELKTRKTRKPRKAA